MVAETAFKGPSYFTQVQVLLYYVLEHMKSASQYKGLMHQRWGLLYF